VGEGLLIVETSLSHPNKTHAVGLLWTSVQSVSHISTWQHTILTRQIFMKPEGLASEFPARERTQTYALDHGATGIGPPPIIPSI